MSEESSNFIWDIIDDDLESGRETSVHTRFPPEPNGYLHIGSCKAIYINSQTAKRYGGRFNLRYDDTNPVKEDDEYVQAILDDLRWLGAEPTGGVFYGSDYFDESYKYAVKLIEDKKAYVCSLSQDEIRIFRGTLTEPGQNSPDRERDPKESLDLFERMKNGEFAEGEYTLRAKIDMSSPNMNMRDPVIYRVLYANHHRQGDKWCIYPMYDYAHPIQDALEGITHSLCSIEFENNRPLYDWVVDNIGFEKKPHQYEFARLNVTYTVMSKRYLRELVENKVVDGWDDPRMPTLHGLKRRGYTPESIINFVKKAGVAKAYSIVDVSLLEHCIRDELNTAADRKMAVLDPVKLVITNYQEVKAESFELPNNPNNPDAGTRAVVFTKELYIERSDFEIEPPSKFFRLSPGREVRLMGAYIIRCENFTTDSEGKVLEIRATADLDTGGKNPADGRKVKGTVHWVSSSHCIDSEVRVYDRLFTLENLMDMPDDMDFGDFLNPDSIKVYPCAKLEESLKDATAEDRYQFVRNGYFIKDSKNENTFNSIVNLRDTWAKISRAT